MVGKLINSKGKGTRSLSSTGLNESKVIKAEQLHELGHPFFIVNAVAKRGAFGDQARFSIVTVAPDTGEQTERILFLALNERRQAIIDDFLVNDEPIGLLVLEQVDTGKGNPAWSFADFEVQTGNNL